MNLPSRIRAAAGRYLEFDGASYRMPGLPLPLSVTQHEGRYLYEMARLCVAPGNAFEIATAFGYSALWIAAGLQDAGHPGGGRLLTMDSYVEERSSDQVLDHGVNHEPKGLNVAKALRDDVGLSNIDYLIGSSPADVPNGAQVIRLRTPGYVPGPLISFAFIDGHHLNGQPLRDFEAVRPFMDPGVSTVVFHDTHLPSVKEALAACEAWSGVPHVNPGLPGYWMVVVPPRIVNMSLLNKAAETARRHSDLYS